MAVVCIWSQTIYYYIGCLLNVGLLSVSLCVYRCDRTEGQLSVLFLVHRCYGHRPVMLALQLLVHHGCLSIQLTTQLTLRYYVVFIMYYLRLLLMKLKSSHTWEV